MVWRISISKYYFLIFYDDMNTTLRSAAAFAKCK